MDLGARCATLVRLFRVAIALLRNGIWKVKRGKIPGGQVTTG
jgi:hypothetical protein